MIIDLFNLFFNAVMTITIVVTAFRGGAFFKKIVEDEKIRERKEESLSNLIKLRGAISYKPKHTQPTSTHRNQHINLWDKGKDEAYAKMFTALTTELNNATYIFSDNDEILKIIEKMIDSNVNNDVFYQLVCLMYEDLGKKPMNEKIFLKPFS